MKQIIPSVNFHLWEPCNMRCKFCFATFQDVKSTILPKEQAVEIVRKLANLDLRKSPLEVASLHYVHGFLN